MFKLCPPALIYIVFSIAQILIDTFKGLYNTAFMKFVVAILVTLLLNGLCDGGLGVISWIIVFIPFILMTFVVAMLLYIFGLNSTIGASPQSNASTTTSVYIEKKPENKTVSTPTTVFKKNFFPYSTTSPAYESFQSI
jgi:predicted membrane protein